MPDGVTTARRTGAGRPTLHPQGADGGAISGGEILPNGRVTTTTG